MLEEFDQAFRSLCATILAPAMNQAIKDEYELIVVDKSKIGFAGIDFHISLDFVFVSNELDYFDQVPFNEPFVSLNVVYNARAWAPNSIFKNSKDKRPLKLLSTFNRLEQVVDASFIKVDSQVYFAEDSSVCKMWNGKDVVKNTTLFRGTEKSTDPKSLQTVATGYTDSQLKDFANHLHKCRFANRLLDSTAAGSITIVTSHKPIVDAVNRLVFLERLGKPFAESTSSYSYSNLELVDNVANLYRQFVTKVYKKDVV